MEFFKKENLFKNQKIQFIPISAYSGENLLIQYDAKWYKGDSLLRSLENIEHNHFNSQLTKPLRMVVKNLFKGLNNK